MRNVWYYVCFVHTPTLLHTLRWMLDERQMLSPPAIFSVCMRWMQCARDYEIVWHSTRCVLASIREQKKEAEKRSRRKIKWSLHWTPFVIFARFSHFSSHALHVKKWTSQASRNRFSILILSLMWIYKLYDLNTIAQHLINNGKI